MQQLFSSKKTALAVAVSLALTLGACGGDSNDSVAVTDPVMAAIQTTPTTVKEIAFDAGTGASPVVCPTTSHPFNSMLCSTGGINLIKDFGYTEKEFFISGKANVYDLGADERAVVRTSGNPYTDRILVRYPSDPAKFSGRVFVDILNASSGVDLEDTWDRSWKHMMTSGDAYIGITSKTITADALKKFDPVRYADINWKVNGVNEDGLFWDMLSQLGTQLRQPGTGGILGKLQPKWVYLTGQSQSGFYLNTYITAFTDRLEKAAAGGAPLWDGYLNEVGPGSMPLRSEGAAPSVTVPKTLYKPTGVPQIVIMSEYEHNFYSTTGVAGGGFPASPPYKRRADSNTATDKFRFYEVAGADHSDPTQPAIPLNSEISKAKADGTSRPPKVYIAGHEETLNHLDPFVNGALENLHAWRTKGIPAPSGDTSWIWYSVATDTKGNPVYTTLQDQLGNALGGLRNPLMEAPLYRFYAGRNGAPNTDGSMVRLSDTVINGLFSGSCSNYLATFNAATDSLVTGRYIVQDDATSLKALGKTLATTSSNPLVTTVSYSPIVWTDGKQCN